MEERAWPDTSLEEGIYLATHRDAEGDGERRLPSRRGGWRASTSTLGDNLGYDSASGNDRFTTMMSTMREHVRTHSGDSAPAGQGLVGSLAAGLVKDAMFCTLMGEAVSRPFAAERAAEILGERLGGMMGRGARDEGVAELLSISLGKEVRRLKRRCEELDRRGRDELAVERKRGEALAALEMKRADLMKEAMMKEHEAGRAAKDALERQIRDLQAKLRSAEGRRGGMLDSEGDAEVRAAFEELRRQVMEDRERRRGEDEERDDRERSLEEWLEEAREGEREALELAAELKGEIQDVVKESRVGSADVEWLTKENDALRGEVEGARVALNDETSARQELEFMVRPSPRRISTQCDACACNARRARSSRAWGGWAGCPTYVCRSPPGVLLQPRLSPLGGR